MKYHVSVLALGDNLISLSLLKQLDVPVNILGTNHTKTIIKLLSLEARFNVEIIFDDIPSFYNIKKEGILRSIRDFYQIITYIEKNNIREIVFEKKDFRSSLISFFTRAKIYYPDDTLSSNVYCDRKSLLEKIYNCNISLNKYKLLVNNPKIIVINPLARVELKNINHEHLRCILNTLKNKEYKIYLIDIEEKYKAFREDVYCYLKNTTLDDVKQLIEKCDLYIGADSLLVHLAYYLKKNYFIIFYKNNYDFLPPNIDDLFYIDANETDNFNLEIENKFSDIGI